MLLSTNSRYFVRHKLVLRPQRGVGPALPLTSEPGERNVLSALRAAAGPGGTSYEIKARDEVRLAVVEIRDDVAILLIRRRDENAALQSLEHRATGAVREPEREDEEAPAQSAHLFINLAPFPDGAQEYRCVREEVPGVSTTLIQLLLRRILKAARYEYEDGRGDIKNTWTVPEVNGVRSESLGSMVRAGGLRYVELIRPPSLEGLDGEGLIPHPQRMRISIRPEHRSDMSVVDRVVAWSRRNNWRDVQVQIDTGDNRNKVVALEREADAAEVLFVRSELIETRTQLKPCSEHVVDELVEKAKAIFRDRAGWGN